MTNTTDPDARFKLTKARALMLIEQPFYGVLALRLNLIENKAIKTLAVDGRNVFYNPAFINELPGDQVRTAMAHEVGHCVFQHIGRRGARDPKKWNYAGDFVINGFLEEVGFAPIPGYWNRNKAYDGMSADQVYNLLPDDPSGGSGGQPQKELCDILDGQGEGEGDQTDAEDQSMMDNEWEVATLQAASVAKQAGKLPASMERFIKEMTEPKVDWRAQLRNLVFERAKDDYSWSRPNRRYASMGIFMPSLYSERMGTIVVVTDDSGSITDSVLAAFTAEIRDIRASVMPQTLVHISCDARINHVAEFSMEDELKIESKGGGGTDFNPPFEYVEKEGIQPVVFIYLTDLYGPAPKHPPGYPVIWCCTTKGLQGPWGDTIHVDVE